jgi:hypothetical protein
VKIMCIAGNPSYVGNLSWCWVRVSSAPHCMRKTIITAPTEHRLRIIPKRKRGTFLRKIHPHRLMLQHSANEWPTSSPRLSRPLASGRNSNYF